MKVVLNSKICQDVIKGGLMKTKKVTVKKASDRKRLSGAVNLNADEMELLGCDGEKKEVLVTYGEDSITLWKNKGW